MARRQREIYIIDGYNVINFWLELRALQKDISEARDRLTHIMAEYGEYEKLDVVIVFDALFTEDEEHIETVNKHLRVIYTGSGETADSRIERLSYDYVRDGREVHVVTSDGAEQSVVLGAGAYRIPSGEFERMVRRTKKRIKDEYLGKVTLPAVRNEVFAHLDSDTMEKLEALRRKR